MSWVVPSAADIADRGASVFEGTPALQGIDARSEHSLAAVITRVVGGATFEAYLYQAYLANELMPDTAVDTLARHGAIWGVPQEQPATASGYLTFAGVSGVPVPAGTALVTPAGQSLSVSSAGTIASSGTGTIAVSATASGTAGNVAAGVTCALVSPIAGISPLSGVVTSDGITGGLDLESIDSWRSRILARIRAPANGGSVGDYQSWVQDVLPGAFVSVQANWVGAGSLGVIVAAPGPAVPSAGQVSAISTHLQAVRPVTASVTVVAATLHPINFQIVLNPDTVANRAAALAGLQVSLAQDAAIGGTVYVSRLDNAISSSSGEYSHERIAPAADVALGTTEIAVLGTITWGA